MKKNIFVLFLLSYCTVTYSQIIKGTVLDGEFGKPISYASVYVNGSSLGTLTDTDGKFSLNISNTGKLPIAVNALGYYSTLLADYSSDTSIIIRLSQKLVLLNEIIVNSKPDRDKYMEWFKTQFLGRMLNSSKCYILNEDDIAFQYNSKEKKLIAYSYKPIIINNRNLAYGIIYNLDKFEYSNSDESLKLLGSFIFSDSIHLYNDSLRIERRRQEVYLGSRMHFFRSLWRNNLEADGFAITNMSGKIVSYDSLVIDSHTFEKYLKYKNPIDIRYDNNDTYLKILKDSVLVDKNGYFDPTGIDWTGTMVEQRISDLLPYDFIVK